MDAISGSAARADLATTMNRVCNEHEALIITCNGDQSIVMLSGFWSRRTRDGHRVVHEMEERALSIAALRCHD